MTLSCPKLGSAFPPLCGLALLMSATALSTSAHAADYSQPGPLSTAVQSWSNGKVAYPTSGNGPFPTLVLGHGALFASADQQIGWGEHFASYGFVAIAVNLGSFPDGNGGAPIIQAALDYLDGAPAPLSGLADTSNLGLEGFSAGGQSFAVAAVSLKPQALVLFDPVGGSGMGGGTDPGGSAVPNICSPTITIFTEPSTCNSQSNWAPFAMASSGPRATLRIDGATHCDGENADRALCGTFCGGAATPARQGRFAHYGTAWFLAYLKGDSAAFAEVTDSAMAADGAIKNTGTADGPDCDGNTGNGGSGGTGNGAGGAGAQGGSQAGGAGQGGSAGSQTGTGGSGFGGSAGDSSQGGAGQAGSDQGGADPGGSSQGGAGQAGSGQAGSSSGDDSGCSCRTTGSGRQSPGAAALLGLLGLAVLRRRRNARREDTRLT